MALTINKTPNIQVLPVRFPSAITFTHGPNGKQVDRMAIKASDTTVFVVRREKKNFLSSKICTQTDTPLGAHTFKYNFNTQTLEGGFMETFKGNRGKGIGEIMRLLSIINMRENELERININSISDAIPFHTKYKFLPNIKDDGLAVEILSEITNKVEAQQGFRDRAFDLRKMIRNGASVNSDKDFVQTVNLFIGDYIQQHSGNWSSTKLTHNLPMTLTKERIADFAEFFNRLFQKHKIAYEINN